MSDGGLYLLWIYFEVFDMKLFAVRTTLCTFFHGRSIKTLFLLLVESVLSKTQTFWHDNDGFWSWWPSWKGFIGACFRMTSSKDMCKDTVLTFDPIFFSMSRTRTFCWMYMSSGDFPGASSRFIPPAPVALDTQTNPRYTRPVKNRSYTNTHCVIRS